ncbi:MAG TPA: NTF2-like N-terminal transpeptidase domain-containing protein, partial [Solirubrobacteraceae bacterium]|nr:NTF2-like N-terminal transpeptidase domain-containing protein [Solirubrobacteraceae bacterium]
MAALLVAVLVAGIAVLLMSGGKPAAQVSAERFADAWTRNDYARMYAELSAEDRRATTLRRFTAGYRAAAETATTVSLRAGEASEPKEGVVTVAMTALTRSFGRVRATLTLPIAGTGDEARIDWAEHLTFPGVARGETLVREARLPRRADILARDGTPLARGADRTSPLGDIARSIVGDLGPAPT